MGPLITVNDIICNDDFVLSEDLSSTNVNNSILHIGLLESIPTASSCVWKMIGKSFFMEPG